MEVVIAKWEAGQLRFHDTSAEKWYVSPQVPHTTWSDLFDRVSGAGSDVISQLIEMFRATWPELGDPRFAILLKSITRESPGDARVLRWVVLEQTVRDAGDKVAHLPPMLQEAIRTLAQAPDKYGVSIPPEWLD